MYRTLLVWLRGNGYQKEVCTNSTNFRQSPEAVSKVTDTASFLGYYSNVTLMEGFYAAIL